MPKAKGGKEPTNKGLMSYFKVPAVSGSSASRSSASCEGASGKMEPSCAGVGESDHDSSEEEWQPAKKKQRSQPKRRVVVLEEESEGGSSPSEDDLAKTPDVVISSDEGEVERPRGPKKPDEPNLSPHKDRQLSEEQALAKLHLRKVPTSGYSNNCLAFSCKMAAVSCANRSHAYL